MTDSPEGRGPADSAASVSRRRGRGEDEQSMGDHVRHARAEVEQQFVRARAGFDQANDRIKERTGRNLLMAVAVGIVIGAAVLASLLFEKALFLVFVVPVALLGILELTRALQAAGRRMDVIVQMAAGGVMLLMGYFFGHFALVGWGFAALAVVIVWRLVAQMAARDGRRYGDVLGDAVSGGFVQLYVPFLAGLALLLLREKNGEFWVLTEICVAIAADTGAYAVGVWIGRHPMAPRISPKKTWEGFGGAVFGALVVGGVLGMWLLHLPLWASLLLGLTVLIAATVGDLGESMIKRDLGIKDMSSWLPGHGGVLDRLDSILPTAPAALALYYLFIPLVTS